jgi:predicted nucleotide-binding protein (sugar kinase/HSP70/actin superfamily)
MKIGIPQGLLYARYHVFAKTFFEELGAEILVSPNTNKSILDEGVRCCVDEACLPMKVYHGHVAWLKNKCDAVLVPRLMGFKENESICPMFCGLPELIRNQIPELPVLIDTPVYSLKQTALRSWAKKAGGMVTRNGETIHKAFEVALQRQQRTREGFRDEGYFASVALIGHPYNLYDSFINMNLKKKLNALGIGVRTVEQVDRAAIDHEVSALFKKPFWSLAQEYYGAAVHLSKTKLADGILYLSSFSCGIDSVVTELIACAVGDFPMMVLKLDEHTGEAGFDTRLDAFSDMLKRRIAQRC